MARTLKAKLKIESDTKDAQRDLKKLGTTVGTTKKSFLSLGKGLAGPLVAGFAAVSGALVGVVSLFKAGIANANEQEAAVAKLDTALKSLGSSAAVTSKALQDQADQIQRNTTFSNESVIEAQAVISAFTQEEAQIKALTKASLDLATAKGVSLTSAADLIAKSFGTSVNALSRYGVAADAAAGSSERLSQITDSIANLWGGQANAAANTFAGSIAKMGNNLADTLKIIGQSITGNETLRGSIDEASVSIESFNIALSKNILPIIEKINTAIQAMTLSFKAMAGGVAGTKLFSNALKALNGDLASGAKSALRLQFENRKLSSSAKKLTDAELDAAAAAIALTKAQTAAADAAKILAGEQDSLTKGLEGLGVVLGETVAKEIVHLNVLLSEAQKRYGENRISLKALEAVEAAVARKTGELNDSLRTQSGVFGKAVAKTDEYGESLMRTVRNVDVLTAAEVRNADAVEASSQRRISARAQEDTQRVAFADRGGDDAAGRFTNSTLSGGTFFFPDTVVAGVNGSVNIQRRSLRIYG